MNLRWLLLVPVFVALAAGVMLLGPYTELSESNVPFDESPARSIEDAAARIEKLGPHGIALYRAHLRWDALFIFANLGILVTPLLVFATRLGVPRPGIIALLVPASAFAGCDLFENMYIARALAEPDSPTAALTAAGWTTPKFISFAVASFVTLATALCWIARALLRRSPKAVTATS